MERTRLSMRKIREVLRLKASGLSYRAIARACLIGKETVREYLGRAAEAGLTWPLPEGLSEEELERRLFRNVPVSVRKDAEPDWSEIHRELCKKGVTRHLLWEEYRLSVPQGYHYSQFCERHRRWTKALTPVRRIPHKAGEKMFVDYAGATLPYTDCETGEAREAAVFVAALGASSLTYAEAQASQELSNWISGHVHAFEYVGGVTEALVPDNTKTGVTSACFYEPELNPTYQALAEYYGAAVLPTRVQAPKHKAKVETAVIEDLDFSGSRGLDRSQVLALTEDDWIRRRLNVIITGPTGAGKTYLACALGQSACRNGVSVRYFQISKLLQKITYARAEGCSPKFLEILAKTQLRVIDDWLRNPLSESQTPDLLEILEDRYGRASTMLATQIPVADWHDRLGNATLSDAVMDRIIHNAYRLELHGESMRKRRSPLTHSGHKEV